MRTISIRVAAAAAGAAALVACGDLGQKAATAPGPIVSIDGPSLDRGGRGPRAPIYPGQVIVRYREGAEPAAVAARHGGKKGKGLRLARLELIDVPAGAEEATVAALNADPDVEFAEVDEMILVQPCEVGLCENPSDGFNSTYKWDLHNTGTVINNRTGAPIATGKADADVDWLETYDALGGNAFTGSAIIGILDTGILPTHFETEGRVIAARNFATSYPSDFIDDRDGHGTHVATIAAARADGRGMTGIAYGPNIRLINAKVCERYLFADGIVRTSCPTSSQAEGIVWAVDQGANVLNLSIGGSPLATAGSPAVKAAMEYAVANNVLPVCAAGNDNYPNTAFPGRFEECMSVAATNWGDARASYSNYAGDTEVSAPGGDGHPDTGSGLILAAGHTANNSYAFKGGTSMAAPQVAGLAALLYATGITDMNEIRERIKASADPLPGTTGMGAGRINVYRAVTGLDPFAPPVAVVQPVAGAVEGTPVAFSSAGSSDPNNHPITYLWAFGDGNTSTDANPSHTFVDNGTYAVTLTVTDESNHATTTTQSTVVVNSPPSVTASAPGILSGATASLTGSFSDLGANDGPWALGVNWGNGSTAASLATQGGFGASATAPYCAPGSYSVAVSVTDKDGGVGTVGTTVAVTAHVVTVSMPAALSSWAGSFPVTIFGRAGLTGSDIDVASVRVAGVPVSTRSNGSRHAAVSDENGDGIADLVVHVSRQELVASAGSIRVVGTLLNGCTAFTGSQQVK